MMADTTGLPVAVIGAGFSGTMVALQVLAASNRRPVLLCERAENFGRGLAYATDNPAHVLNVRAANMSAFPDRPDHFEAWLARTELNLAPAETPGICRTAAGTFVARGLYGRYLAELLIDTVTGPDVPRLRLINDAVVDLEPTTEGFLLRTEGGLTRRVAGAVLAMGNLPSNGQFASRHRASPWRPEGFDRLDPTRPVLIVGTGLTMVDAVAALRGRGFAGPVVAISRRGLLPSAHAPTRPWPVPTLAPTDLTSLSHLLGRIRAEIAAAQAADADWRGVLDALRPITDSAWKGLPAAERARFLRHLRPYWDVHRHRMAPPVAEALAENIARGSLAVRAGRILSVVDEPAEALVTWLPRRGTQPEAMRVQCIFDATGVGGVAGTHDPLLTRLLDRGLIQPGPFGLGLDTDAEFRVLGPQSQGTLWTIGPLLRGVLWECTAVPDIRTTATRLAATVVKTLDSSDATSNEKAPRGGCGRG
ncbi:FAD/NAD(P)-binding protein [Methylobacterium brachiatum]|uniref:FAD/NAD(P)-binding protein n=1 Tax=Methylobacterium brachiatum TaxID=269660 RepID=UPI0008E9CF6F|nr:FAD/NAD(P)-binding protein [Methylobacterium brachiatum]SFI84268.1 Uncharacterized NAD(P)/FAD-binding protein YdhS [Methylobacterium brachiatum]